MNVTKKVIAVIVIAVILIRAFTIEAFALAGAPVIAAEEITALLETALIGSGLYNESELDGKNYNELNDLLKDGINSGQINPKVNYFTDPITEIKFDLLDLLFKPEVQAGIGIINGTVSSVVDDVISDFISDYEKLSDSVELTPTFDLNGHGGGYKMYQVDSLGNRFGDDQILYFDKLVIYRDSSGMATSAIAYLPQSEGGAISFGSGSNLVSYLNYGYGWAGSNKVLFELYGDVRYEDETPFETDEETLPVIGEADGTQVTPDMLNPDGTVTIDGTTYYPKDFIDWDKFKDLAIIDLLNQILDAIDNAPVVSEQDKPIVDVDSIEIAVPDELSDYTVPVGITSVFPFCLPFDFARGIKMLLAKPEVPVFKTEIDMTDFCGFDLGVVPLEISLEKWEPAVVVIRWFNLLLFIISLIFISTKIVKGAGA